MSSCDLGAGGGGERNEKCLKELNERFPLHNEWSVLYCFALHCEEPRVWLFLCVLWEVVCR